MITKSIHDPSPVEVLETQSTNSEICIKTTVARSKTSYVDRGKKRKFLFVILWTTVTVFIVLVVILLVTNAKHNVAETTTVTTPTAVSTTGSALVQTSSGTNISSTTALSSSATSAPTTTGMASQLPLVSADGTIRGVYNTTVGASSTGSTAGTGVGQYAASDPPANACDNDTSTKYLNLGSCNQTDNSSLCGLNTGLYLELQRGSSLVTGIQSCTANDSLESDPLIVSLEGSNLSGTNLTLGISWSLIYNGTSGLGTDPGRSSCGSIQSINNSVQYKSYRFLVFGKRSMSNSVQYSEVRLFGY
ncbi:unnamed protein product [Adineta ricciae]|uniref:Uncharacterized protein n=1 Tax=Adineta ricciae TaxID=249248 RepID=A0A815NF37_ADIRI|nr:unnamed protein product [Adineta ricciae]CAF1438659.1 unnamed protein product [Adineta ricciae]